MARIVLVGFPGSGKTTVGKKLASKLQYDFVDLDAYFELRYKVSVELFFEKYDENAFRICERQLMQELLQRDHCVISTGGGTPCFFDTMDLIQKSSISIYLKMSSASLVNRLLYAQKPRPLLKGKGEEDVKKYVVDTLAKREPYFLRSSFVIKGENIDIKEIICFLKEKYSL